jgi:hypothetical protein
MPYKLPFISDEHHYAITNVALRVGQLDWQLEHLISTALPTHRKMAEFLLTNLGADRLIGAARAVLLDVYPDDEAEISGLFDEIKAVRSERNELLHWVWGSTEEPTIAIHTSVRPFRQQQEKMKTAQQIQDIADRAMRTIEALVGWQNKLLLRYVEISLRGQ